MFDKGTCATCLWSFSPTEEDPCLAFVCCYPATNLPLAFQHVQPRDRARVPANATGCYMHEERT